MIPPPSPPRRGQGGRSVPPGLRRAFALFIPAAVLISALVLAAAARASEKSSEHSRIQETALMDWDLLFLRRSPSFFESAFEPLRDLSRVRHGVSGSWIPTYDRRGETSGRIYAKRYGSSFLYAPNSALVVGLSSVDKLWIQEYADRDWSLQWKENRRTLPLSVYYRGKTRLHFLPLLSAMGELTDAKRGAWRAALLASGSDGKRSTPRWSVEVFHSRDRSDESLVIEAPAADTSNESWNAAYRVKYWEAGLFASGEFSPGSLALKTIYRRSRPDPVRLEYQLVDSSQTLLAGAEWKMPVAGIGRWTVRWEYAESQTFFTGLRLPPGASEYKRFHHALGRSYSNLAGVQWRSGLPEDRHGLLLGVFHRFYRYRSSPHPHAYRERKETLSYNRLESSFLASVYGGFHQSAEMATAFVDVQSVEVRPALKTGYQSFAAEFSLPVAYIRLKARFSGETVTRTPFTHNLERTYDWEWDEFMPVITPGIALRFRSNSLAVSVKTAHAFVVRKNLGIAKKSAYPWNGNGALLQTEVSLEF